MNPLTNVKNINKINDIELAKGTVDKKSWHDMYRESAWVFIGGLSYGLTEGDILSVFSQYGEIVNINLVRDKKTGKIKGFCFLCYANQKSTVLAVDNFNGIKLCGRTIRVDHVANYKPPKEHEDEDEITKQLKAEGCAPKPIKTENPSNPDGDDKPEKKKSKKAKKEKKKHKKNKKKKHSENPSKRIKIKEEKQDPGYSKYELPPKVSSTGNETSSSSQHSDRSPDNDSSPLRRREKGKSSSMFKDQQTFSRIQSRRGEDEEISERVKKRSQNDSSDEADDERVKRRKSQNAGDVTTSGRNYFESSSNRDYSESTKSAKGRTYSDASSEQHRKKQNGSRTRYDPKHTSSTYKQGNSPSGSGGRVEKHHRRDSSYDSESDSQGKKRSSHNDKKHESKHYNNRRDNLDNERKHSKGHNQYDKVRHRSGESKKHGEVGKSYERESRKDRR